MGRILENTAAMLVAAIGIMSVGLFAGIFTHNFIWFARSGALVQVIGIALLSRASLIGIDIRPHSISSETGLSHLDPIHYEQVEEPVPDWVKTDSRTRAAVGTWGPLVSFIGTLIWAFGDLLDRL